MQKTHHSTVTAQLHRMAHLRQTLTHSNDIDNNNPHNLDSWQHNMQHSLISFQSDQPGRGSKGSIVFGIVTKFFFLRQHDNSWTAVLSLMKFWTTMHLDNL